MKPLLFVLFWSAAMNNLDSDKSVLLLMKDDYSFEYDDIEEMIYLKDNDLQSFLKILNNYSE